MIEIPYLFRLVFAFKLVRAPVCVVLVVWSTSTLLLFWPRMIFNELLFTFVQISHIDVKHSDRLNGIWYMIDIYIYIIYDQAAWFAVGCKGIFLRAFKVVWSHRNIRQVLFALFLLNRPADTLWSPSALFSALPGGEAPLLPRPVHWQLCLSFVGDPRHFVFS